jgi:hypothetical protein
VLALFQQMRAAGIAGDTITYTAAIEAYARGGLDHSPPDAERYADDGADGEDGEDRGGEGEDCGEEEGEGGAGGREGKEEGAEPGDWEAAAAAAAAAAAGGGGAGEGTGDPMWEQALALHWEMQGLGIEADLLTYSALVSALPTALRIRASNGFSVRLAGLLASARACAHAPSGSALLRAPV